MTAKKITKVIPPKEKSREISSEEKLIKTVLQRLDAFEAKLQRLQEVLGQLDMIVDKMKLDVLEYRNRTKK